CGRRVCPSGQVCTKEGDRCVFEAQIDLCAGQDEGAPCSFSGSVGACFSGVCLATGCGNGVLEPDEVCDDGNRRSGDGCAADCRSNEVCGNGIIDVDVGERCDDGSANADSPDAACRSNCQPQHCGDGVLDTAHGEACDGPLSGPETC